MSAYKCPKCKEFILTDYCHECDINIRDNENLFNNMFGGAFNDIFGGKNE